MRALSFQQPWLYTIFELGKDVENRKWACFDWMIGIPFLIHSSAGFDREGYEWLLDEGYDIPDPKEFSAETDLVALSKSAFVGRTVVSCSEPYEYGAQLFSDHVASPWAFGPHVWKLRDVERLDKPVPHKGALGFWKVDPVVASDIYVYRHFSHVTRHAGAAK